MLVRIEAAGSHIGDWLTVNGSPYLLALEDLIEAGKVTPVIDATYNLSDAAKAVSYVGERHTRGKTAITI